MSIFTKLLIKLGLKRDALPDINLKKYQRRSASDLVRGYATGGLVEAKGEYRIGENASSTPYPLRRKPRPSEETVVPFGHLPLKVPPMPPVPPARQEKVVNLQITQPTRYPSDDEITNMLAAQMIAVSNIKRHQDEVIVTCIEPGTPSESRSYEPVSSGGGGDYAGGGASGSWDSASSSSDCSSSSSDSGSSSSCD